METSYQRGLEIGRMMAFAARHDWGATARVVADSVSVAATVRLADGELVQERVFLHSMSEMRDWAGY